MAKSYIKQLEDILAQGKACGGSIHKKACGGGIQKKATGGEIDNTSDFGILAKETATYGSQGAAAGSAAGPWGTLVGGIVGSAIGNVKGIYAIKNNDSLKKRKAEYEANLKDYMNLERMNTSKDIQLACGGSVKKMACGGSVKGKADGGEVGDYNPYEALLLSKLISARNQEKNFVKRGLNPSDYPVINNEDGSYSTHRMAYSTDNNGGGMVFPTIIQKSNGSLEQLNINDAYNYAVKNNESVQVPSASLAKFYSENGLIQHKADGGYIDGAGTGKSDSISANLKASDFIVPVDSPYYTEAKLALQSLGNNGTANKQRGSIPAKISKGELLIPAEQRSDAEKLLIGLGVSGGVEALAPNADYSTNAKGDGGDFAYFKEYMDAKPESGYVDESGNEYFYKTIKGEKRGYTITKGGRIYEISKLPIEEQKAISNKTDNAFGGSYQNALGNLNKANQQKKNDYGMPNNTDNGLGKALQSGLDVNKNTEVKLPYTGVGNASPKTDTPNDNIGSGATSTTSTYTGSKMPSLGTISAASQGVLGAINLMTQKSEPNREISPEIKARYDFALQDAQYGLHPSQKASIRQDIETNRRSALKSLIQSGGIRSSGDALNRAMAVNQQANRAELELNVKDAQVQAAKQAVVNGMATRLASEQASVYGANEHKYERDQRSSAGLLRAGINNLVEIDRLNRMTKDPVARQQYLDEMEAKGLSRYTSGYRPK